jgi:hypothetical protein
LPESALLEEVLLQHRELQPWLDGLKAADYQILDSEIFLVQWPLAQPYEPNLQGLLPVPFEILV